MSDRAPPPCLPRIRSSRHERSAAAGGQLTQGVGFPRLQGTRCGVTRQANGQETGSTIARFAAPAQNIQVWMASVLFRLQPTSEITGGYARGLLLVAVTVREDACRAGAGSSGVARGARVDIREVHGRFIRGRRRVHGACCAGCVPEHPECAGRYGWGPRAVVPGTGESGAEVLLPAGLGSCTGLYVAVRGIGGGGAGAHVDMADSVAGTSIIQRRLCRSGDMWRCRQGRAVKPSAQPTLVRTQHLPPTAKTAR